MLNDDEVNDLARDLVSVIERRVASKQPATPDAQIVAALQVAAGLKKALPLVSRLLDAKARAAGMSYAAIGRAGGQSRQSAHSRVRKP